MVSLLLTKTAPECPRSPVFQTLRAPSCASQGPLRTAETCGNPILTSALTTTGDLASVLSAMAPPNRTCTSDFGLTAWVRAWGSPHEGWIYVDRENLPVLETPRKEGSNLCPMEFVWLTPSMRYLMHIAAIGLTYRVPPRRSLCEVGGTTLASAPPHEVCFS